MILNIVKEAKILDKIKENKENLIVIQNQIKINQDLNVNQRKVEANLVPKMINNNNGKKKHLKHLRYKIINNMTN